MLDSEISLVFYHKDEQDRYTKSILTMLSQVTKIPSLISVDLVIKWNDQLVFDELLINVLSMYPDISIISEFGLTINRIKNLQEGKLGVFRKKGDSVVFKLIEKDMFKVSDCNLWIIYPKVVPIDYAETTQVFLLLEP
jgi:hypothetical protein